MSDAPNATALANEFATMLEPPPNGVTVVNQPETEEIEVQARGRGKAATQVVKAPPVPAPPKPAQQSYWRGFLDRHMPTAESLKVYKRQDGGKQSYINSYTVNDIQSCPDIEVFLQRYLMPKHGAGEYDVALVNSKGETSRIVQFNIIDPNPKSEVTPDRTNDKVIDKLFAQQEELRKQLADKPKEPSMGDKLTEMKMMMEMFGGGPDAKKGMDPMMMMMMMKMISGDDKPKGPDPAILAALEGIKTVAHSVAELSKEVREIRNQPLPAPMPLPDPGPSPLEMVKVITDALRPQTPVQPPMNPMDMIRTVRDLMPQPSSMQPKDMLGIAAAALPMLEKLFGKNEIHDLKQQLQAVANGGSRGLREVLQDMQMLQQVMGGGGESDSDSFWAVAGKLVDNIGEVASVVEALRGDDEAEDQPRPKKQKQQQVAAVATAVKKKIAQRVVDDKIAKQDMPVGFDKKVARIENAEDGNQAVDATLKAFFFLARKRPKPFNDYLKAMMEIVKIAAAGGDESSDAKEKFVQYVEMFLNGLKSHGILKDETTIPKTVDAFRTNVDRIVKYLMNPPPVTPIGEEAPKEG